MAKNEMTLTGKELSLEIEQAPYAGGVQAVIKNFDTNEALEAIGMNAAIEYFGDEKILDKIGVETIKRIFGLIDEPTE